MQYVTSGFLFLNRKCDKPGCDRESPLWRIFRGCGHSFHVECNLPEISVCQICMNTLRSKIESLSKSANEAVLNFCPSLTGENQDDNQDSDCEEFESTEVENEDLVEQQTLQASDASSISTLISRISAWHRVEVPSL